MKDEKLILIDFDNTLINNDKLKAEIYKALIIVLGRSEADHFWGQHNNFAKHHTYVDFPLIIKEYCSAEHAHVSDEIVSKIFSSIDVQECVVKKAGEALKKLHAFGTLYIFTEGDEQFQRAKVEKSGLLDLVDELKIYQFKMEHFKSLVESFSAPKTIYLDDKPSNLDHAKKVVPEVITVWIKQGHYYRETPDYQNCNFSFGNLSELTEDDKLNKLFS